MQKGNISVQTENIFPIIKQFLYSDQEIFLRELVSNAVDATQKLRTLSSKGEFKGELGDTRIEIILDEDNNTLTIRDKGIGMNEEEVMKYLNQVAFSSAQEFLDKYKDDASVIGHFGLGFYSAFMVADKVDVKTKSYKGDQAVVWSCTGNPEYELDTIDKDTRGTDIVLHIAEDSKEYMNRARIQELLDKYCKFLPVEIQFGTKTEVEYEGEGDDKERIETEVDNIVNNPHPLWKKKPSELTDEDYKAFYKELYPYAPDPLFWIHLNIDFPFDLTGVLYFPKLNSSMEVQKNKIHLYSNQVYVTDEVKEIVPEFLMLLHGVIDSPDIPLNVSRSYLQSDANVKKITNYITKKVADQLNTMFKKDRAAFEDKWDDISVFVKYGIISEEKFNDKAQKFVLLKDADTKHHTIEEYKDLISANQTDKHDKIVAIYANSLEEQYSYIQSAKDYGYNVLVFDHIIDNHFMQHLEQKLGDVTFVRVDSDTIDKLVQTDEEKESILSENEQESIKTVFTDTLGEGKFVDLRPLSPTDHPVLITKPEFMRRMKEMQMMQGMDMSMLPDSHNVVVNTNHPLIAKKLLKMDNGDQKTSFTKYLYMLAKLNQKMLTGEEMNEFIDMSIDFLED